MLIAGINPRRALDDSYRGFFDLVTGHMATAVANSRAYEEERRRSEALAEMDVTERKRAEEERERLRQAQAELAHINRVSTMGELAASLAHEIKQPITAAVTDAKACLRWLDRDQPAVVKARESASRLVRDAIRASDIISRIGSLFKKDIVRESWLT